MFQLVKVVQAEFLKNFHSPINAVLNDHILRSAWQVLPALCWYHPVFYFNIKYIEKGVS